MKILVLSILITFLQIAAAHSQNSQLGTTRSDDLQIKARLEYERRNQKQPQSHTAKTQQSVTPKADSSVSAPAPTTTASAQKGVTCKNGGEVRELYVEYKGAGCELFYSKLGQAKSQARQNNGKSVCESVFEQMKSTIEKTGFVCESKAN